MYEFETTPKMSSYLLVFVIGSFELLQGVTKDGIPVQLYLPFGCAVHGKLMHQLAIQALEFYKSYLDIPYTLPKLDLVVLHGKLPDYVQTCTWAAWRTGAALQSKNCMC